MDFDHQGFLEKKFCLQSLWQKNLFSWMKKHFEYRAVPNLKWFFIEKFLIQMR